ncbi:hypothetical protein BC941DRAFT_449003 [Chlamydoabsidia padenii]|nr:hypothetical protein BC941DRAFT_449003 [Chlamydoabsidia padenii]
MPGLLNGESTTQSRNVRRRIAVTHAVQDASLLHIQDQHIVFVLLIHVIKKPLIQVIMQRKRTKSSELMEQSIIKLDFFDLYLDLPSLLKSTSMMLKNRSNTELL